MMGWLKLLGPLATAGLLVYAGLYVGEMRERANNADRLKAELVAAKEQVAALTLRAAKANAERLRAQAFADELERGLEDAHKKRVAPKVVRVLVPDGASCLGRDALGVLNGAANDYNRAVRAASSGVSLPAR